MLELEDERVLGDEKQERLEEIKQERFLDNASREC